MKEINACPRCASRDLHIPTFSEGIVPETDNLAEWTCGNCDLRTTPVVFDDEAAYLAFKKSIKGAAT